MRGARAVAVSLTAGASATGPGGWDHLGDAGAPGSASLNAKVSVLNAEAPGALLAGGTFDNAGGVADADRLARWNGSAWSAVAPGLTGEVRAIAQKDGRVFVGGTFSGPGGVEDRNNLAVWDGAGWGTVCNDTGSGTGPVFSGNVDALQIIGSTLWVGGEFQDGAHIATADYLVACDLNTGAATSPFTVDGHGSGAMHALTADSDGNLYGAGTFINLAGIPQADYVAKWDGAAWSALGSDTAGTNGWFTTLTSVYALTTSGSQLFAAGSFQNANGDSRADNVASFDGSAWHPVGSDGAGNGPLNGESHALATFGLGAPLHAGGNFTNAGGDSQADFVATYAGATVAVPTPTVTQAPPPVPTPTVTPAPDTTPPAVSVLKLSASAFRPLRSGASIAAVKRGTTVRYRLSETARVPFTVQVQSSGRRVGRRCVKPTPSNRRKKPCIRFVKAGGFAHSGVAGQNRFLFSGRVKRRALKPGNSGRSRWPSTRRATGRPNSAARSGSSGEIGNA